MARLIAPIQGHLVTRDGHLSTPYGHDLDAPLWQGAEIGFMETRAASEAAICAVRQRGWSFGVHHPLVQRHAWDWAPFWLDPDPDGAIAARRTAADAAGEAADLGASYVLFHYPWPSLIDPAIDYPRAGWKIPPVAQPESLWPRERLRDLSMRVFSDLEDAALMAGIRVVVELDGPNAHFFPSLAPDDLCKELFLSHPALTLCIDTGRFDLLARQHGGDPVEYTERWLPFARHLHLHGANWDLRENHLPPLPDHESQPGYAPVKEMALRVVTQHEDALVVLETNPARVTDEVIARSMLYCADIVARTDGGPT